MKGPSDEQYDQDLLVSVIMPTYNSEKFLREAIESVFAQTYENWQLVLVDDGSKDWSRVIAEEYALEHPGKIVAASHPGNVNRGASATRNVAIKLSKGSLIAFLDSDDKWTPDYLSEQVAELQRMPQVDSVLQAAVYWTSWADQNTTDVVRPVGADAGVAYAPGQLATRLYPLVERNSPCLIATVIRRSALDRIGLFEESFVGQVQLFEDQAFAIKNYLYNTVYISAQASSLYRQRLDSLMHGLVAGGHFHKGRLFFLRWLNSYLKKHRINDSEIRRLLNRALFEEQFYWLVKYLKPKNYLRKMRLLLGRIG